jgi:hypothetical protein
MAYTTVDDSEAHFQVALYTGNGSANHAITLPGDTDMQPDFVWIKNRDATDSSCLFDSIRGATKLITSDFYSEEATDTDTLDSFTSDGFQVDADDKVNTNTEDYVAWCWKGSNTSVSNSTGDITSTVCVNTTAGFSIVKFDGNETDDQDIGHSLGAIPHALLFKTYTSSDSWVVYHHKNTSAPETDFLALDTSDATTDEATMFSDQLPTSTVFTVGTNQDTNRSSSNSEIVYCFTEKQGFSKFGSYIGNGNANGPFIFTGFRPALIIIKLSSSAKNWYMFDNKRDPINDGTGTYLLPNENSADGTGTALSADFLSNGFKWTGTNSAINGDGDTYVYMAWAEAPFVNSEGVPGTAR